MLKNINSLNKLLEEIEDIYFGTMAQIALEQTEEYIDHEEIKKNLFTQSPRQD